MAGETDRELIFEAVCDGELRAEEVRDLRAALAHRISRLRDAQAAGDALPAGVDLALLDQQLAVLREEEMIAQFVEEGLTAGLRRAEILAQLREIEDLAG